MPTTSTWIEIASRLNLWSHWFALRSRRIVFWANKISINISQYTGFDQYIASNSSTNREYKHYKTDREFPPHGLRRKLKYFAPTVYNYLLLRGNITVASRYGFYLRVAITSRKSENIKLFSSYGWGCFTGICRNVESVRHYIRDPSISLCHSREWPREYRFTSGLDPSKTLWSTWEKPALWSINIKGILDCFQAHWVYIIDRYYIEKYLDSRVEWIPLFMRSMCTDS